MRYLHLVAIVVLLSAQPFASDNDVTLTGILLVSDHPCGGNHSGAECRASDFALLSGRTAYLLYGDACIFRELGRQRVRVRGDFTEETVELDDTHLVRRKISVHSVEKDKLPEQEIERLVQQLSVVPWQEPENHCRPLCWIFGFTDPMVNLLQAGPEAEGVLLRHIGEDRITDQIVILLGGVGDEKAVPPIIAAMADANEARFNDDAKRRNLIANIALTNLTVGTVIWHHGGGIPVDACPDDPKSCWSKWWNENRESFRAGIGGDRLYTNYPDYGIYAQFNDASPQ